MGENAHYDSVTKIIEHDEDDLVALCLELGNLKDYPGHVRHISERVLAWFKANDIHAFVQPITDESANTVAVVPGTEDGTSLILNAHMDSEGPPAPDAPQSEWDARGAWVNDGMLFGWGVINDKAQLCAEMIAVRALQKAGVRLKGDLIVAAVDFETGEPSVDDRQGVNYPGSGFGAKWLIDRGVFADYALVGETSDFGIITAECGNLWLKVTVPGTKVYTPRLRRGPGLAGNPNANERAAHVIVALEEWARQYEKEEQYEFPGGLIIPKAQVYEMRTSGSNAHVYLDVRLAPGKSPKEVTAQVRQTIERLGLPCEVTPYDYQRGYLSEHAEPLIGAIEEAHRYVFGENPPTPPPEVISMWRDSNAFNAAGIPSVCYGPRRQAERLTGEGNRALLISDLVEAAKVYALTAMALCGVADD